MDQTAFEELYRRLSRTFFKVASARVGPLAAQDVVHEVFEVVWTKRAQAPLDASDWAPWSWGILRNKILQELQRRTRKHHDSRFADDYVADDNPTGASRDVAETVVESDTARATWDSLSEDDRELLLLVSSTDLPGADLAHLMGISHDAYRRRVSRMRARLAVSAERSLSGTGGES